LFCIVATAVGGSDFPPLAGLPRGTPVVFGSGPAVPYGEWALTNVVKVDANRGYAAALRADGTVVRWGSLADDQVTPTLRSIVSISAGGAHTLALDADGRLHAWIAEGNVFQDQILPIPPGLGTVRKIAAGYSHSVVVDTAGRVWAWGANTHGAYDPPVWATNALEVTAGQLYCGLILEDRSVRGWFPPGWTATDGPPAGHAPAVQVDASIFGHVLSLREDGRVFAWGSNEQGQATVPATLDRVVQVAAGGLHSVALREDGTVAVWGDNTRGQGAVPSAVRFFAMAAADYFSVGLTRAPVAYGSPRWLTVMAGEDVEIALDLAASDPYVARWYREDALLETGPAPVVRLINVQSAMAGTLRLVVSNEFGFTENTVNLAVETSAPRLTQQPASAAVFPGSNVRFEVAARGSEPLTYQWQHEGVDVPGATASVLELTQVTPAAAGAYRVVVRNALGEVLSSAGWLSAGPPVMVEEPLGLYQRPGFDTRLSATVLSPEPVTCRWHRDGVLVAESLDPVLALGPAGPGVMGAYAVVAGNTFGSVTSAVVRVRPYEPVLTAAQPSLVVAAGQYFMSKLAIPPELTNVLAVAAGDAHGFALREGGQLMGWGGEFGAMDWDPTEMPETGPVAAIASGRFHNLVLRTDGTVLGWGSTYTENYGQWYVPEGLRDVVAVSAGHRHSLALRADGSVVQWPAPGSFPAGASNVIAVAAGSDSTMLLQADGTVWDWVNSQYGAPRRQRFQRPQAIAIAVSEWGRWCLLDDGVVLGWNNSDSPPAPVAGGSNIVAIAAQPTWDGPFFLRADGRVHSVSWGLIAGIEHATAIAGSMVSVSALTRAPFLDETPVSTTVAPGGSFTLNAAARSSTPFTYQWEHDGINLTGATQPVLTVPSATAFDRGTYRVRVLNDDYELVSAAATVTVAGPVEFRPLPSVWALAGSDLVVTPIWAGEGPARFQWQHEGVDLPGQTNATLVIGNIQEPAAGGYQVQASNPYGASVPSLFTVTVAPSAPWIQAQPAALVLPAGSEAVFRVDARGSEPLAWQWTWNGTPLAGATNPVLRLSNVQAAAAGAYAVEVRNARGWASSVEAGLTVEPSPPVAVGGEGLLLALEGNRVILRRPLIGSAPMTFQWRREGVAMANATDRNLEIAAAAREDAGSYTLVAENALGTVETPPVDFRVVPVLGAGVVMGWGNNPRTGSTSPLSETPTDVVAVDAGGNFAMALHRDGTVQYLATTPNALLVPPADLTNVVKVVAGAGHALALRTDGAVVGWGGSTTAVSDIPSDLEPVVDIAVGLGYGVALARNGRVRGWGRPGDPWWPTPFVVPADATNGVALAAHDRVAAALRADHALVWMGQVTAGHRAVPAAATNLVSVDLGSAHALGLRRDGNVVLWGSGSGVRPMPAATNVVRIAAGPNHNLALRADGTVVAGGDSLFGKTNVPSGLSNVVGIAAGYDFSLAITRNPVILSNLPSTLTVVERASAELPVGAVGAGTLRYRWFRGGEEIPGATNGILRFDAVRTNDAGSYWVRVENAWGAASSRTNRLTVLALPFVAVEPEDVTIPAGTNLTLAVVGGGQPPLAYQWRFGGVPIDGAASAALNRANVQASGAGGYDVVLSNAYGAVTSRVAQVTVLPSPPGFIAGPSPIVLLAGDVLRLSARIYGTEPVTCVWQRNGVEVARTVAPDIEIPDAQAEMAGNYVLVVTNALGQTTSPPVAVVVQPSAPRILVEPADTVVRIGQPIELEPVVVGSRPLIHQWAKDGTNLAGLAESTLRVAAVQPWDQGAYRLMVTNGYGAAVTRTARVAVDPPAILIEPVDLTLDAGDDGALAAVASGSDPRVYQWTRDGLAVPGDGPTLRLVNVQSADAGLYRLTVTNATGGTATRGARLVVDPAPARFAREPLGHTVLERRLALFHADARGTPPLAYQWYREGIAIPGATGPSWVIRRAAMSDAGSYTVTVTNELGSTTSPPAVLTVLRAPAGVVASWGPVDSERPAANDVVQVAWGAMHGILLTDNGLVQGWGYFDPAFNQHVVPEALTDVVQIAAGGVHSLALRADGTVAGWGDNYYGQYPPPPGTGPLIEIAAARHHTAGIDENGRVVLFGGNTPVPVAPPADGTNAVRVATGNEFVAALRADGTVAVWSLDGKTRFPVPEALEPALDVVAGNETLLARHPSGRVTGWVAISGTVLPSPAGATNVVSIAAGYFFAAQRADGGLLSWGTGTVPEPAVVVAEPAGVFAGWDRAAVVASVALEYPVAAASVAAGDPAWFHVAAVGREPLQYQWSHDGRPIEGATGSWLCLPEAALADMGVYAVRVTGGTAAVQASGTLGILPRRWGALVGWGNPSSPVLAQLGGVPPRVRAVAGAWDHAAALLEDATVWSWGNNSRGQTTTPAGLDDVVQVSAGEHHTLALRRDGRVMAWGGGDYGQAVVPPDLPEAAGIAAGWLHSLVLKCDGTLAGWGYNSSGQATPPALHGVIEVAGGFDHSVALHVDGTLSEWGYSYGAQPPLPRIVRITGMNLYFGAISEAGTVHRWHQSMASFPTLEPSEALAIAPSTINDSPHMVSLLRDRGLVRCAGYNSAGQVNTPGWLRNVIAVGAAREVSLAVTTLSLRSEPENATALEGTDVVLGVDAVGAEPIRYQWHRDGHPIPGGQGPTLRLAPAMPGDSGLYSVTVGNEFASLTSGAAAVVVLPADVPLMEWRPVEMGLTRVITAAVRVTPGRTYEVQTSGDLLAWVVRETFVAASPVRWLQEPVDTHVRARFYRLVEKP